MSAGKLLVLALLAAVVAGAAAQWPEVQRYLNVRAMDPD